MKQVLRIAADLLLEATRRNWFAALFGVITLALVVLGFSLQLDVVDGAIAGSSLFGKVISEDLVMSDRVLGPLYFATAYSGFYFGTLFLVMACSDFAPELLAAGRIEHLLSLPLARWQLLAGTWLGVLTLALLASLYGAIGLTVLLGFKTSLWSLHLVAASGLGWLGFCAVYSAMLAAATFVRSSTVSGAVGMATLVFGILASKREAIAALLEQGVGREAFRLLVLPFPQLATLATVSARVAAQQPMEGETVVRLALGCLVFSAALLSVAAWRFEGKDF